MASSTALFFALFLAFVISSAAREIVVGGKTDAWKVPSSESDSLNKWAEKSRFRIGDSLVWKYDGSKDSVVQVNEQDYVKCNTSRPIEEYKDGNTKVTLNRSGAFFFVSGAKGHCEKGQKLHVVVLSPRTATPLVSAPAPAPAEDNTNAVPPTTGAAAPSFANNGVAALMVSVVVAMGFLGL